MIEQCSERCNICAGICKKPAHAGKDYHKCNSCGTLWYGRTHRQFPFPGWWMDKLYTVGYLLGYEYLRDERRWRKEVRTYVIIRRGSQIVFRCKQCTFEIDTALYGGITGPARTKAATAMRQHYQADHVFSSKPSSTQS